MSVTNCLDDLIKNYENTKYNLIAEIKEKSNQTWTICVDENKNNIKITNKYLTYLDDNIEKNKFKKIISPILNKQYINKNEILSVVNNIMSNKTFVSNYIYFINNLYAEDDIKIKSLSDNEFELIYNTGYESCGNTYRYKISKLNLLDILEKIICEIQ